MRRGESTSRRRPLGDTAFHKFLFWVLVKRFRSKHESITHKGLRFFPELFIGLPHFCDDFQMQPEDRRRLPPTQPAFRLLEDMRDITSFQLHQSRSLLPLLQTRSDPLSNNTSGMQHSAVLAARIFPDRSIAPSEPRPPRSISPTGLHRNPLHAPHQTEWEIDSSNPQIAPRLIILTTSRVKVALSTVFRNS
jgi:hypothetical protein